MSTKAARGTKRVCQSCGNKFYDLNRDPITCPICDAVFQHQETRSKPALPPTTEDDEDDEAIAGAPAGVETVSLDEVEADENEIPDLEDNELVEIEDEDADLGKDDETFIEVEEGEDDDEVSGIVSGSREDDEET
jgi:uncharacterized protein (TIGR02300 family)